MEHKLELIYFEKLTSLENNLNSIVTKIISEVEKVSTLYFQFKDYYFFAGDKFKGETDLFEFLGSLTNNKKKSKGNIELIYGLYIALESSIRFEELNGINFSMNSINKLLNNKLALLNSNPEGSLLDKALFIKDLKDGLPPSKVIFQNVNGTDRSRTESILERKVSNRFLELQETFLSRINSFNTIDECLLIIENLSSKLGKETQADMVLFSGHRDFIPPKSMVNIDRFFSYIYFFDSVDIGDTGFQRKTEVANYINEGFRGSVERQFNEGYKPLLPSICINEANREQHHKAAFKSIVKCHWPVLNIMNAVDLRCTSSTNDQAFNENSLNTIMNYAGLYAKIIERALLIDLKLPISNAKIYA